MCPVTSVSRPVAVTCRSFLCVTTRRGAGCARSFMRHSFTENGLLLSWLNKENLWGAPEKSARLCVWQRFRMKRQWGEERGVVFRIHPAFPLQAAALLVFIRLLTVGWALFWTRPAHFDGKRLWLTCKATNHSLFFMCFWINMKTDISRREAWYMCSWIFDLLAAKCFRNSWICFWINAVNLAYFGKAASCYSKVLIVATWSTLCSGRLILQNFCDFCSGGQ